MKNLFFSGSRSTSKSADASKTDDGENIQISRSDGRIHDLNKVFRNPATSEIVSQSSRTPIKKDDEEDHGRISITRSDGVTHDIIKVFTKYASDSAGETMKLKNRSPSMGKIELPFSSTLSSSNIRPVSQPNPTAEVPYYMKSVRIIHMSDTHNFLSKTARNGFLPNGHILVHSGNFSSKGTDEEFAQFNDWLGEVAGHYHYRIVCLGNRDVKVYGNDWDAMKKLLPNATHVLCHSEATVLGIKFYAAPWHWGHKKNYAVRAGAPSTTTGRFDDVPFGVHVLVTHGPAFDRLDKTQNDEHWGSRELSETLRRVRPGVHLHGHVKDARGFLPAFGNFPLAVNSSMCDVNVTVMYAVPHVIRADQMMLDSIRNVVDWSFAMDSFDG